jgi:hypothetical protein
MMAFFKTPFWVGLRFVSNSTAAKATILVPIIGYLIIFNDKVVEFLNLARGLESHTGSEVSLRLIFIYLGLCALSMGVIVYSWLCPNVVKYYGSASAYVQGDGPSLRGFVINDIAMLLEDTEQGDTLKALSSELRMKSATSAITAEDTERYRIEILHLHFDHLNKTHAVGRAICFWSYVVGFGLLAIPSLTVFTRVIIILIGRI